MPPMVVAAGNQKFIILKEPEHGVEQEEQEEPDILSMV